MEKQDQDSASLKDILKKNLNVDYPISGGKGKSIEDAIIIECEKETDGVLIEYEVVADIMKLNNTKGRFHMQSLSHKGDKHYDKLVISFDDEPDKFCSYYFDISNFYGKF